MSLRVRERVRREVIPPRVTAVGGQFAPSGADCRFRGWLGALPERPAWLNPCRISVSACGWLVPDRILSPQGVDRT
jgi:hypothetical protein